MQQICIQAVFFDAQHCITNIGIVEEIADVSCLKWYEGVTLWQKEHTL
jgi:hypothetical protein